MDNLLSAKVFLKGFQQSYPMFEPRDEDWLQIVGLHKGIAYFFDIVKTLDEYAIRGTADLNPPDGIRKTEATMNFLNEVISVEVAENRPYRLKITPHSTNPKNICVFQTWLVFDHPMDFSELDEFLDIIKQSNMNLQKAISEN